MALIKCPECGTEVSSIAETCPKCNYPIAGGGNTQAHGGKVQTVEQTSKRFKLQQLLSVLVILVCLFVAIAGCSKGKKGSSAMAIGSVGMLIGFLWYAAARFSTWWHHG